MYFWVKVVGDSMKDCEIFSGDMALIKRITDPPQNKIGKFEKKYEKFIGKPYNPALTTLLFPGDISLIAIDYQRQKRKDTDWGGISPFRH